MVLEEDNSLTWDDKRFPRNTPTLTVLAGLRSSLDASLVSEEIDTTTEIAMSDVTESSIKVTWTSRASSEYAKTEVYDLQWQLDGSETWNSLPDPLTVPKVRFDHLAADTRIFFRVRKKSSPSSTWSAFSRVAAYKTLPVPRLDSAPPPDHRKSNGTGPPHPVRNPATAHPESCYPVPSIHPHPAQ